MIFCDQILSWIQYRISSLVLIIKQVLAGNFKNFFVFMVLFCLTVINFDSIEIGIIEGKWIIFGLGIKNRCKWKGKVRRTNFLSSHKSKQIFNLQRFFVRNSRNLTKFHTKFLKSFFKKIWLWCLTDHQCSFAIFLNIHW